MLLCGMNHLRYQTDAADDAATRYTTHASVATLTVNTRSGLHHKLRCLASKCICAARRCGSCSVRVVRGEHGENWESAFWPNALRTHAHCDPSVPARPHGCQCVLPRRAQSTLHPSYTPTCTAYRDDWPFGAV